VRELGEKRRRCGEAKVGRARASIEVIMNPRIIDGFGHNFSTYRR
jgi:hypothetical protein